MVAEYHLSKGTIEMVPEAVSLPEEIKIEPMPMEEGEIITKDEAGEDIAENEDDEDCASTLNPEEY